MREEFKQPPWNVLSAFIHSYDIIFDLNKDKLEPLIQEYDYPVCQMALIEYFDECIIKDDSDDVIFEKMMNKEYNKMHQIEVLMEKLKFHQDMINNKTRLFLKKYDEFLIDKQHVVRKKNHKAKLENILNFNFRTEYNFKGEPIKKVIDEINELNLKYAGVKSNQGVVYFHIDKLDVGQIKKLIEGADEIKEYWLMDQEIEEQAKNLIQLFGTAEKAVSFIKKKYNKDTYTYENIHSCGNIFINSKNFSRWIPFVMEKPTVLDEYGMVMGAYEEQYGPPSGKITDIIDKLNNIKTLYMKEHPEELVFLYCRDDEERQTYIDFFRDNKPKSTVKVPSPEGIVHGEYVLRQLDANDPLQTVAGAITNCCQHLNSAASDCAEKAYTNENCAIWSVFKENKMISQAFVWRPVDRDVLIIDSIESLIESKTIVDLYIQAAHNIVNNSDIKKVYLGVNHSGIGKIYTSQVKEKNIIENKYTHISTYESDSKKITLLASK